MITKNIRILDKEECENDIEIFEYSIDNTENQFIIKSEDLSEYNKV